MPNEPIPSPNWPQPPSATYRDPSGFSIRRGSENNLRHPGGAPSSHGHPPKSASAITASMVSGSDIPRAASYAGAGSFPRVFSNTGPTRPGVGWSPQLCELIMKADGKLKVFSCAFVRVRLSLSDPLTTFNPSENHAHLHSRNGNDRSHGCTDGIDGSVTRSICAIVPRGDVVAEDPLGWLYHYTTTSSCKHSSRPCILMLTRFDYNTTWIYVRCARSVSLFHAF